MRVAITSLFLLTTTGVAKAAPPAGTVWALDPARSDEFDGPALDAGRWTSGPLWYASTGNGWPFAPSNGFVTGGSLNLQALNGNPLTVAAVHSNFLIPGNSYVEVRAKALPRAANILTAIWVQGPYTDATNPNVEIDIQETFHWDAMESNTHVWDTVRGHIGDGVPHDYFPPPTLDVSADFHVYGLERRANVLRFYFDGQLAWETRPSTPNYYTQDRWLIFSLEGHLGTPNTAALPAAALIDYVRTYTTAPTTSVCGTAFEAGNATLTCPAGQTIQGIEFASYGTPNGACGAFTVSTCHASSSTQIVSNACMGQASCSVAATNAVFGDPCFGIGKRLDIQAACAAPPRASTPVTFEAENLAFVASSIGAVKVTNASGSSNNGYVQFTQGPTPAVGDFIELTLPAVPAGTYRMTLYFKSNTNRGINQARLDGISLGVSCDEYAATAANQVSCSLGAATLAQGDHKMRFTIAGKNPASSSYAMTLDKVVLTPQ